MTTTTRQRLRRFIGDAAVFGAMFALVAVMTAVLIPLGVVAGAVHLFATVFDDRPPFRI